MADNGSTDGSQAIATRMGARIVHVEAKGYGNALMGGIAAARGKFIIMGDADDSYDFREIPAFVAKLQRRIRSGSGVSSTFRWGYSGARCHAVLASLVGQSHVLANDAIMFRAPIHDVYCGMRGFTKDAL